MQTILTTLIVISSCFFFSCNKCELENSDSERKRITKDIMIELDTVYGQLVLYSYTEQGFGYNGLYSLNAEVIQNGNSFNVEYKCIEKRSGVALATHGSAVHRLNFQNIDYYSPIDLEFKLKGRKYSGRIENGQLSLDNEGRVKLLK